MVGDTGGPAQDGFDGNADLPAYKISDCHCSGNLHHVFSLVKLLSVPYLQDGILDVPSILFAHNVEIFGDYLWADYDRGRRRERGRSNTRHYTRHY